MVEKKKVGDTHLCGVYVPPLFLQCWFKNELSVSSTDVLEMRAICDSSSASEDIVIASYAIYVQ